LTEKDEQARGTALAHLDLMAKRAFSLQTSNKAGVRSLAKKEASTRHRFDTPPAARKVAGASGRENRKGLRSGNRAEAGWGGKSCSGSEDERSKDGRRALTRRRPSFS
jgi:hypothetical protein